MQKHSKKLISLSLALLTAFALVTYQDVSADSGANAGHFYVFNISAYDEGYGWSYNGDEDAGVITISESGDYQIVKECSCQGSYVHEGYQIVISGTVTVNLIIMNVNIQNNSNEAMRIDGGATVTLTFEGDNSFISTNDMDAGIEFNDASGSLTITSNSLDNTLTAIGGTGGAGIGGAMNCSGRNITISGGTVIAIGGYYGSGAGIGSGYGAGASNITISGGNVIAIGGDGGSGIGGFESAENIIISGGNVIAIGGSYGAGIGGGRIGSVSNITISGGNVYAEGGTSAVGIGAGQRCNASNITISGGTVTATGGYAGIGAAENGTASNITISGGSVKASSITVTPQNEDGENVYLVAIPDMSGINSVTVEGTTYTRDGDHIDYDDFEIGNYSYDGTFYLYLTGEDHEITVGDDEYKATWDDSTNSFTVEKVGESDTGSTTTTTETEVSVIIVDTSTR